jgi:hypothetical protein
MARVKAIFYIPLLDNDGRDLEREIDDLEDDLYAGFVGWTFLGYIKAPLGWRTAPERWMRAPRIP